MKNKHLGLSAITLALTLVACQSSSTNQPLGDDATVNSDTQPIPEIDGSMRVDQGAPSMDAAVPHDADTARLDQGVQDAQRPPDQNVADAFSPPADQTVQDDVSFQDATVDARPPLEPDSSPMVEDAGCVPEIELCNGVDDDCDGSTDEFDPANAAACDTGRLGVCARGRELCQDGVVLCETDAMPGEEECNGRDDDCDGRTDEAAAEVGDACQTASAGVCSGGRFECVAGALRCAEIVDAEDETCNGLDDDCDGRTDESFPVEGQGCNTNRPGICRPGTRQCVNGRVQCVSDRDAIDEICDGDDQDCDGVVDEAAIGTGVACNPGWAIENCTRRATIQCTDGDLVCTRDPEPADPCNDIDNDCDGRIGEDVRGQMCNTGLLGRCSEGSRICEPGGAVCASTVEPECETDANGIDDDCDGSVDEAQDQFCGPPESFVSRFCLDDNDQTLGLDMYVDELGDIYFTRTSRVLGHLYYSRVLRDGSQEKERMHSRVSLFPDRVLQDTSLIFFEGRPHICYRAPRTQDLYVTFRTPDGEWNRTIVEEDDNAGADCALSVQNERLVMAYSQGDALKFARRNADGTWSKRTVDNPAERSVGRDLSLIIHNDAAIIAHRDATLGALRLTYEHRDQWHTLEGNVPPDADQLGNGFRPTLTVVADQLLVFHGGRPLEPDAGSDSTLYMSTTSWPPNVFQTEEFDIDGFGGGQSVIPYEDGFLIFARQRIRNALGFRFDGLSMRKVTEVTTQRILEDHSFGDRRHLFTRLRVFADPFGLPIMGFSDEGSPFGGDQGYAKACFYRPTDSDADWVPDIIEHQLGTEIFRADSDGDGRTDGQEILLDNTDPLRR